MTTMAYGKVRQRLRETLDEIDAAGLTKRERRLTTPQSAHTGVVSTGLDRLDALNFCANNYLGLADDPRVVAAASEALQRWGFGMASVRFICGTQELHADLEADLSAFLG